jgi:hypothetical protein
LYITFAVVESVGKTQPAFYKRKEGVMINRGNWKAYKAYLEYLQEVKNLAYGSVRMYESLLKHLVIWAGSIPFEKV